MNTQYNQLKIIDIIAPSAKCSNDVFSAVQTCLQSWKLEARIAANIFGDDLLYANSLQARYSHLIEALENDDSFVVWCLLGGYGATGLIPLLAETKPIVQHKLFLGFSDITALHIFLQNRWGWKTFHAPNARQVAMKKITEESIQQVKALLLGQLTEVHYGNLEPLNQEAKATNKVLKGEIIGGNLCLMQASLGTFWQMDATNKFIFIEEVSERAYRVDRALQQLDQAGLFKQAKAILLGDFFACNEPDGKSIIEPLLRQFAERCQIPVLQLKGIGHDVSNLLLPLGYPTELTMGMSAELKCRLG